MDDAASQALEFCSAAGRICPEPMLWNDLYGLLARLTAGTGAGRPPPPLILAAWWEASDESKAERLKEQIEWAAQHGISAPVLAMLRSLSEEQWHHCR